jgi:hypothetical protein
MSSHETLCIHKGVAAKRTCYDGDHIVLSDARYIGFVRYPTCWKCKWLCQGCGDCMALAGWCSECRANVSKVPFPGKKS